MSMRMPYTWILAGTLFAAGSQVGAAEPDSATSFSQIMKQRSTQAVDARMVVGIGDITGNAVSVSLSDTSSKLLISTETIANDQSAVVRLGPRAFRIQVSELSNSLVGEDYARITIRSTSSDSTATVETTETVTVETLINIIRADATNRYERNGTTHSGQDAAALLEHKLGGKRDMPVADFIEQIATKSSTTGQDYFIIFPDGTRMRLADHLRKMANPSRAK